jgi:hypothetical protein
MRNLALLLLAIAIGLFGIWAHWMLWQKFTEPTVVYQTVERVVEVERTWADAVEVETPVIDSLLTEQDWAEVDRQSDCLFDWLTEQVGYEITLERVLAAGWWTDALGGACLVIGEDE